MNDKLKNTRSPMNKYQKKYMEKKKILCVMLDNKNDADIIAWLNSQGEKQKSAAVRKTLRRGIAISTPNTELKAEVRYI